MGKNVSKFRFELTLPKELESTFFHEKDLKPIMDAKGLLDGFANAKPAETPIQRLQGAIDGKTTLTPEQLAKLQVETLNMNLAAMSILAEAATTCIAQAATTAQVATT